MQKKTSAPPTSVTENPRPFHVLYGGAQRFKRETFSKLESMAQDFATRHAAEPWLGSADAKEQTQVERGLSAARTLGFIEDFRIDFEDGFGALRENELRTEAARVALALTQACAERVPPWLGIRIPSVDLQAKGGASRVLLATFFDHLACDWPRLHPGRFAITHPKVMDALQLAQLHVWLSEIETQKGWPHGTLAIEAMYEAPTEIRDWRSSCGGRLRAVHFGAYDYLNALAVPPHAQGLMHPLCVRALCHLREELFGTEVTVSDGVTIRMPLGSDAQIASAAALHRQHIEHAIDLGVHQGWDLHPHQVVVRRATWLSFFARHGEALAERLRAFFAEAGRVSLVGNRFDDSASARALVRFFAQGLASSAWTESEAEALGFGPEVRASSLWQHLASA